MIEIQILAHKTHFNMTIVCTVMILVLHSFNVHTIDELQIDKTITIICDVLYTCSHVTTQLMEWDRIYEVLEPILP